MGRITRRGSDNVEWRSGQEVEIDGKKQAGTRSKWYFDPEKDGSLLLLIEYAPGFTVAAHSHPVPEIFYVVRGELQMGGQRYRAGDGILIDPDTTYGPLTAGPEGLAYIAVRMGERSGDVHWKEATA